MAGIFISYVQKDRPDFVRWLYDYLQGARFQVMYDQHLTPGDTQALSQRIHNHIQQATYVLVVVTKGIARTDTYVHKEIALAQSMHKILIPLLLEHTSLPPSLEDQLSIDFTGDRQAAAQELVSSLKRNA